MKFLSNTRAKFIAAAITAVAAIAIPAQAVTCSNCQSIAESAGKQAGNQALANWQASCAATTGGPAYAVCMSYSGNEYSKAYSAAYSTAFGQCMMSCS